MADFKRRNVAALEACEHPATKLDLRCDNYFPFRATGEVVSFEVNAA